MQFDNPKFAKLVADGQPTGEVIGVDRFLITVRGLGEVGVNALIYFENGHLGLVREVRQELVTIINMSAESIPGWVIICLAG
jgi:F0F1-type ATP synthase alpha subunit